jgi:hypothetical protein
VTRIVSATTLALVLLAPACLAQTRAVDGLASFVYQTDRDSTTVLLDGLPSGREVQVETLAGGSWSRTSRAVSPVSGTSWRSADFFTHRVQYSSTSYRAVLYYRARAVDGSPVSIRIVDALGRTHCEANSRADAAAVCLADVPHTDFPATGSPRALEFTVQAELRGPSVATLVVEGLMDPLASPLSALTMQNDPIARPSGEALVTLPVNLRFLAPGRTYGRVLTVTDDQDRLIRHVAITERWEGTVLAASHLVLSAQTSSPATTLSASSTHSGVATHRRLAFLVPPNVPSVEVTARSFDYEFGVSHPNGTPHDLVLQLYHAAGDASVAALPLAPTDRPADLVIDSEPAKLLPEMATERITLSGAQLKPGRWYAVPVSKTGIPLNVNVSVRYAEATRRLEPQAGHYFNPARAGHGFYLAKAGSDWILIWFTYDTEGQPVWYYAQDFRPSDFSGGSQWIATLYRNVWNGSRTRFQFVGWVQMAAMAEDRLEFAHLVNGRIGVESMQRLGLPGCSQRVGGQPLDANGLWYAPQKSGYGFSAEMIGSTEFYLAYAYDALGRPRWATAQQAFGVSTRTPLLQASGFCPTCSATAVVRLPVGELTREITGTSAPDGLPGFSVLGIDARWINGVPGGWAENRPAALIGARAGCQ